MSVLRVYDPAECDEHGVPPDWERCRTCEGTGGQRWRNVRGGTVFLIRDGEFKPFGELERATLADSCTACGGHGSLKAAALAAVEARVRADLGEPSFAFGQHRCEGCGHPMSDGTWATRTQVSRITREAYYAETLRRVEDAARRGRVHFEHVISGLAADLWLPCEEWCRHDGPGRVPCSTDVHPSGWLGCNDLMTNVAITRGFEASWRAVDVRTLGRPHDLRVEKLAVLCLRCYAERQS